MPKAERSIIVLRKREKQLPYPVSFHVEAIATKAVHWLFVIVGVVFFMLVVRALIRGIHSDNYSSPTWSFQLSNR